MYINDLTIKFKYVMYINDLMIKLIIYLRQRCTDL